MPDDQQQAPHPVATTCVDNGTFVPQSAPIISRIRATEEETAALAAVGQPTEEPRTSPAIRNHFLDATGQWRPARRGDEPEEEAEES